MPPISFQDELFRQLPVIGILRGYPLVSIKAIVETYLRAGFHTLEITWNSPGAKDSIQSLRNDYGDHLNLGVGTILTRSEMHQAIDAGAKFVVTPIVQEAVIKDCVENQIPVFPGAYTPTEVYMAWKYGATAVKLFPAEIGGLPYLKAIKAPLSDIPLVPTGGISIENITDFLTAGVFAVGMGSQLFPRDLIVQYDWKGLEMHLIRLREAIKSWGGHDQ